MTPKEKAKELVSKFIRFTPADEELEFDYAKQCALIAVDEMLSFGGSVGSDLSDRFYIYWRDVKQEIEKL